MTVVLLTATLVFLLSLASVAQAVGPQPLPAAACNQGTQHAHTVSNGAEHIAHYHDFDGDGTTACYHRNPTYPPANPGLE